MAASDPRFMARAIELSRRGWPAPNPHVGCVIVRDGEIVGEGWHEAAGLDHAEAMALKAAGDKARGADIYVTQEPCNHHGRTPPCSLALIQAGAARVFAATTDPNPPASNGAETLRAAGIPVEFGMMEAEATEANLIFQTAMRRRAPYVVLKAAITLDGKVARPDGSSKWITGPEARAEGHRLRARCGCVLVGRGTVEADNPELTARIEGVINQPVRAVLDSGGRLTGREKIFADGHALWFTAEPTQPQQIQIGRTEAGLDLHQVMQALWNRGIIGVLVEGGPQVLASFLAAGLGDELHLFLAPRVYGNGFTWTKSYFFDLDVTRWHLRSLEQLGTDLHLTWKRTD